MPADTQTELLEALRAIDSATLQAVARDTGIGESTLWRYRAGAPIPEPRRRVLERALALR